MEEGKKEVLEELEQTTATVEETTEAVSGEKKPKKRRKWLIILVVVVIVLTSVGTGFWVWHEQPSFCATMCHETMGSYLEGYEDSDYLVHDHAQAGLKCLDCHEPVLEDQIAELGVQLSGDYRLPLAKMEVTDEFCLRDGCHSRNDIIEAGENIEFGDGTKVNPHSITFSNDYDSTESPHSVPGETLACSTCHSSHRKSTGLDYCYGCHHTETTKSCYECHDHR